MYNTTHPHKMNKFYYKKNTLPTVRFEPTTFRLVSSCHGITFFTGICISPINHLSPIGSHYSGGPSRGHENRHCCHQQHYPEPFHPIEKARYGFTGRLELPGPPEASNSFYRHIFGVKLKFGAGKPILLDQPVEIL